MDKKFVITLVIILLVLFTIVIFMNYKEHNKIMESDKNIIGYDTNGNPVYISEYSGPVPEDCSIKCEQYYRETGITDISK